MIARALKTIAIAAGRRVLAQPERWHEDTNADCVVFSYKQDFRALWRLGEPRGLKGAAESLAKVLGDNERTFLIVWDDVPERDFLVISRYVTPYDWAAALSLATYEQSSLSQAPGPKLRFLILDLPSAPQDGYLQRSLFAFHNAVPWIQGYRVCATGVEWLAEAALDDKDPAAFALLRQAVPQSRQDAKLLISDLKKPERVATTFPDDENSDERGTLLNIIREMWRQEFLKPGDRHVIANLIGPFVLASGLPGNTQEECRKLIEQNSLTRRALLQLPEQLGLLERADERHATFDQSVFTSDGGIFGRRDNVRFLLVDDEFSLGYQHILACVLRGHHYRASPQKSTADEWHYDDQGPAKIKCVSSAKRLFSTLQGRGQIANWSLPRILDIPDCDILLLDLRLWHDDINQRRAFMEELVGVSRLLGAERIKDPRFKAAFSAACGIATGEGSDELQALPLFALLLSYFDPSLPIILFSSTHQRDVVELVAHRPNIITYFSKPVLARYSEKQRPGALIRDLVGAVRKALDLHEARIVWERILECTWSKNLPPFEMFSEREMRPYLFNRDLGPTKAPAVRGEDLKSTLAGFYLHYLVGENYFDFAALPFEFLERVMTPEPAVLRQSGVPEDAKFRWPSHANRRNKFATGLKDIRDKKAHGFAPAMNADNRNAWRLTSILGFLTLLDYIEEKTCLLGSRLRVAFEYDQYDNWLHFVLGKLSKSILDSQDEDHRVYGAEITVNAIDRLLAKKAPRIRR